MQTVNSFLLQEIVFTTLKNNLLNVKIFKIMDKKYDDKFIFIKQIQEDNSSIMHKQFNILLSVFANSFNHKDLFEMFDFIIYNINYDNFKHLNKFVNIKLLNNAVSSSCKDGFMGEILFACFFEP